MSIAAISDVQGDIRFDVQCVRSPDRIARLLDEAEALGAWSAFATRAWFQAWLKTLGAQADVTPCWVRVADKATQTPLVILPLVQADRDGMNVVSFCDFTVTDYNSGWVRRGFDPDAKVVQRMWTQIRSALPPCDLIHFEKLLPAPEHVADRDINSDVRHPLMMLPGVYRSRLSGQSVDLGPDYAQFLRSLAKKPRKELERSWRLFSEIDGARFELIEDRADVGGAYEALADLQRQRMAEVGADYVLDDPSYHAFYRAMVDDGLTSGACRLAALRIGDSFAAVLLALHHGESVVMLRLAHAGDHFGKFGPGRLLVERMMRAMHERGVRQVDFAAGDYDYKRRLGAEPVRLHEYIEGRSLRGRIVAARERTKAQLRSRGFSKNLLR